ncbi:MAG: hypothetical protein ABW216_12965, partial [Candidatus Rokuibacteriota bacterium]
MPSRRLCRHGHARAPFRAHVARDPAAGIWTPVRPRCPGACARLYALWKLWGLLPGIAAATLVAVGAFWWQRRQANSGIMPAVGLGIALIQAVVGLASGSAS